MSVLKYKDPVTGEWISAGTAIGGSGGGADGKSAYEIACDNGFIGTEQEWLLSLKGKDGEALSISEINLSPDDGGRNSVVFSDGSTLFVANGSKGSDGSSVGILQTVTSEEDGGTNVVVFSDVNMTRLMVKNGSKGSDGRSAYEYARDAGYGGTEADLSAKLAAEMPTALKNPSKLIFTGAASGEYDGSAEITVNIPVGESETETILSDNLFDKSTATKGKVFYYGSSGYSLADATYQYYAYVPLDGTGVYRTKWDNSQHNSTGTRVAVLKEDNSWLQNVTGILTATDDNYAYDMEFTITQEMVNNGAAKFAFDCHSNHIETVMVVKNREYPAEYIPYGYIEVPTDSGKKLNNPLTGKTAVFLGDSICAGTTVEGEYYGYGWAGLIGENNKMVWENYGMNGGTVTSLSGVQSTRWLSTQADTAISEHPKADYVIFEGGCNDADQMKDALLGTISTDYATFDTTTFSGALESLILKLITNYPNARIGYIIPQKMYAQNSHTSDGHVHRRFFDRAVEICEKWGIPYLDLWKGNPLNPKLANADLFYTDGQHLTLAGYQRITPQIESFMRGL